MNAVWLRISEKYFIADIRSFRFDPISLSSKKGKRNENCQLINIRLSKKDSCQRIQQEQDNNAMTHSVTWKTEFICVSKFRFAKKYAKITPILVYK